MTRRHFFSIVSAVATGILVVVKGYGQKPRTASSSPDAEASASKKCGMPEATDADVTFERGKFNASNYRNIEWEVKKIVTPEFKAKLHKAFNDLVIFGETKVKS